MAFSSVPFYAPFVIPGPGEVWLPPQTSLHSCWSPDQPPLLLEQAKSTPWNLLQISWLPCQQPVWGYGSATRSIPVQTPGKALPVKTRYVWAGANIL